MRIKFCLFILCFFFTLTNIQGQLRCYIEHYATDDGLPQHTIMSIVQDHKGFMWFSTWNGLSKFDGYNFHSYRIQSGDPYHMRSNRIDFIVEDKYGYIWTLPYDKEPHRFDPQTEKFMGLRSLKGYEDISTPTDKIKPVDSGKVWLITERNGCICIIDSTFNVKTYNTENVVYDIHEDKNFNSWILTDNGLYMEPSNGEAVNSYFVSRTGSNLSSFYSAMESDTEIWFGGNNGEIQIYDKVRKRFNLVKTQTQSKIKFIKNINDNQILFASENNGFFIYHRLTHNLEHYNKSNLPNMMNDDIQSCYIDRSENIWFELDCLGVAKFNLASRKMKHFEMRVESQSPNVFPPNFFILEDISNLVWVHPRGGGFSYYNPEEDSLIPFYNEPYSPLWRFSNMMHTAFSDKQGNLWLSTRSHGLEKVIFPNDIFKSTIVDPNIHSSINNDIRCIFEDHEQNLWVSTKGGKIYVYNPEGKQLGYLCDNGTIDYGKPLKSFCYCMMQDKDLNIWIGSKGDGIYKLKKQDGKQKYSITYYKHEANDPYSLSHNSIYSIFQDIKGKVWVGTYGGGLNLVDESGPKTKFINSMNEMTQFPMQTGSKIRIVSADKFGNICIGTTLGLIVFPTDFKAASSIDFKSYIRIPSDNQSLGGNDIFDICTTSKGETFLATFGGGVNKIIETDSDGFPTKFKSYTTANGLPSDVIVTILEDTDGKLWIATEGNLTKFNPEKESFETYSEISRLIKGQNFAEGTRFSSKSGTIYVGHSRGFLSVKTNWIIRNDFKPYVAFTNFLIGNKNVAIDPASPLNKNIDDMKEMKLNHRQNFFSIEFAALDYIDSKNISYAYKLEGFDQDWITLPKQRIANYTNIEPGEYIFKVKSTNSDGVWMDNEHILPINITPSFWKTGWAYTIYFVLFIGLLYIILRVLFVYFRLKDKVALEHEQTEMKTRFFMDVSHEIRTPLTMIIAPIENVIDEKSISGEIKSQLQLVLKNANRMLRMVNQILDFRKIQKQKMNIQEVPIAALVSDVCSNFTKTAESKNINFKFTNNIGNATLWLDYDSIEKLVFNLLSNAFKFTSKGKTIEVSLSYARKDNAIQLSVKDEGKGMSKEIMNKLFTRFSSFNVDKSNPSTGIGLSIVKEVVEKHHAKISVDSEVDEGSCFSVNFPMGTDHFKDDDVVFTYSESSSDSDNNIIKDTIETPTKDTQEVEEANNSKKTILVVEDDLDLRNFVKTVLCTHYDVLEAGDGLEAYDMAITDQPDFIISDIMMPKLDGIGLLKKIKENSETSHIPFILLSAKTNIESKLEGLDYGADDYITKPFSIKYLKARIENIINQRKHLYESFTSKNYIPKPKSEKEDKHPHITSQDEQFILKMKEEIENNIDNSEYVVNDLATAMAMSRTVFFKKVKSLTSLSPIEFIRDIKIKYAARLLEKQEYSIKEISYMVGIGDTKYFTQCFKKQYGITPSEYRSKVNNTIDK